MTRSTIRRALLVGPVALTMLAPVTFVVLPAANDDVALDAGAIGFLGGIVLLSIISAAVGVAILWRRPGNLIGRLLVVGALLMSSGAVTWWVLVAVGLSSSG